VRRAVRAAGGTHDDYGVFESKPRRGLVLKTPEAATIKDRSRT
jgi:hypothetical protein